MDITESTLGGMTPEQAIAYLRSLYASGQGQPLGPAPLTGMPGYQAPAQMDESWTPNAGTTGQGRYLSPQGTYNGQEGAYIGQFNNGQLQNAYFDQVEPYGFMDQWGGPMTIAAAALGGGALAGGGVGGGAAGAAGTGAAEAAAPAMADSLVSGMLPTSISGSGVGAGLGANGVAGALAAAPTIGMGEAVSQALGAGGASGAAGGGGGGGLLSSLGGAQTLIPAAAALASGISAANAPDSVTSSTDLPAWARPAAQDLLTRAQAQSNQPFTPYGGPNPFQITPQQQSAMGVVQDTLDQWEGATGGAREFLRSVQAGERDYTPGTIERASNSYLGQTTPGASNPYIGQTTQGIQGPRSVMDLARQATTDNPYIGQTSGQASTTTADQAGRNALLGLNNPYLNSAIDQAMGDVSRQYNLTVAPQRTAQDVMAGSFGNTGVAQMRAEDQRNLAGELGRVATNMRMQDYGLQAQLGEGQAGREQATNIYNAGAMNQGSQFNTRVRAQDLNRQTGAFGQQAMFNAGNLLNAGMFDVNADQNAQRFNASLGQNDLARNAQLAGQQSQFNSGLAQGDLGRNAQLTQNLSQFNSGVSGQDIGNQYGAWAGNNNLAMGTLNPTLQYMQGPANVAGSLFNMGQSTGMTGAQGGLFDYGQYQAQQQYPWQQIGNLGSALGSAVGRSGTSTQQVPTPNPWASALGGGLMGAQLYNFWNR